MTDGVIRGRHPTLPAAIAAIALFAMACIGTRDAFTSVEVRNEDNTPYFLQTVEQGFEDMPVPHSVEPESTGSWTVSTGWRGTVRLVDRFTCRVLDEHEIRDENMAIVIRGGRFDEVTMGVGPSQADQLEPGYFCL